MAVNEPGQHDEPGRVEGFTPLVARPDPGHVLAGDSHIGVEQLAREYGEDPAAPDDEVGRLVTSSHGETVRQVGDWISRTHAEVR